MARRAESRRLVRLLSAALPVTALAVFLSCEKAPPVARLVRASLTLPLPAKTQVHSFALSPDGRYLALAAEVNGSLRLWLRPVDALDPQPLLGTEGASFPFWSPDGRSIGFFADDKLKIIAVTGGPVQTVCDSPDARGGAWSREGQIMLEGQHVWLQRGACRSGGRGRFPFFLPDGQHYLYSVKRSAWRAQAGIFLFSLETFEDRQLLPDLSNAQYVAPLRGGRLGQVLFVRNGTLMAQPLDSETLQLAGEPTPVAESVGQGRTIGYYRFSVSSNGALAIQSGSGFPISQLTWFGRDGATAAVAGQPGLMSTFAIAPDGKRIAETRYSTSDRSAGPDIWMLDLQRGTESRFTFRKLLNVAPAWSPDGRSLAYAATGPKYDDNQAYRKQIDGAGREKAVEGVGYGEKDDSLRSWAQDGCFVTLSHWGITDYVMREYPGRLHPWRSPPPLQGRFSPDGKWLAYVDRDFEVYVGDDWMTGPRQKVSTAGGEEPHWRPDGKELFYLDRRGRLMAAAVDHVDPKARPSLGTPRVLFATGLAWDERWFDASVPLYQSYDVAPDGRFLVRVIKEDAESPVQLITNWQSALAK